MDATEAAALSVCAAGMTAEAGAALASCRAPPIQPLTVTEIVDIDELIEDPGGEEFLRSRNFEFKNLTHKEHSFAKRVAGVLYFLASSGTYRATASSMGMNESVLFESVDELTAFLVGILDEVVKFPDILGDWRRIKHGFKRKQGIPGVIGAVDGSLFQIQRPADYEGYYCRKDYTAINMQAIVDTGLKLHKVRRIIAAAVVTHDIFILLGDGTEIDEAIEPTNNDSNDEPDSISARTVRRIAIANRNGIMSLVLG
ncbi:hypothetical protein ON010_g16236 [Phytophthora cinnamomi]|nr:hypothetical protein ON010_g16236 [Phytophthora cinnamomi]